MTSPMIEGKRADSARRERVLQALDAALRSGQDITVSELARTARVDRTSQRQPPLPRQAKQRP
ncbi:hypothetical protein [Streptomyces sp. 2231.1]|uniref:hypothetical protein n=1 Tax=Streptomyces sp. 2231.1 TaxID=1855347 RepID=UPI00115FD9EB|nr:hypothetical protein [Streptomyces sp. 2231.1]